MRALRWHGKHDIRRDNVADPQIDPSFVITPTADLAESPALYKTFRDKHDGSIEVAFKP